MNKTNSLHQYFKDYLSNKEIYKGGKTRSQVVSGKDFLYKMSSNENLLGTSPKALAAIRKNLKLLHEYPDGSDYRLQEALSNCYGGELSPQQFMTANSGLEIFERLIQCFINPGDECIVSNPFFQPYQMFAEKAGAKVIDVKLKPPNFELDVNGILEKVSERTRLIFVTNPNNPTGTYIPRHQVEKLLDNLPDSVLLVYDEVYHHFADAADFTTALPYVQAGKNIIGINSFSKAYGLAGIRIGFAYSTPEIADYLQKTRRPFMIHTLAMEACIAALDDQAFIEKTVNLIRREKRRLFKKMDNLGVHYWKSQTNFFLMKPAMGEFEFEEFMLKEGIMVRPVSNFGATDCVRVTVGTRKANTAFLNALAKAYT